MTEKYGAAEHEQRMAAINRLGASSIEASAGNLRKALIDVATVSLVETLMWQRWSMAQLKAAGQLGLKEFDYYVLLDLAHLPEAEGKPIPALSMLIAPEPKLGQQKRGDERLVVYIPVSDTTVLDPDLNPVHIDRPKYMLVERYNTAGEPRSYLIYDDRVEEFESAYLTGVQVEGEEMEYKRFIERATHRVNPLDAVVSEMMTEFTDWTTQVQKTE